MSKVLAWGECNIFTRKYNGATKGTAWKKWAIPAEGSTTLTTTEGQKTEAKVEGGENEAVRKAKNTYALVFDIRIGANHTFEVDDVDGVIDGEYEVIVQATENADAPALYMAKANLSSATDYNSTDGGKTSYTADALKNQKEVTTSEGKKALGQVAWGEVALGEDGMPSTFKPYRDTQKADVLA